MAHEGLKIWTDTKIRYARLHLDELIKCHIPGRGHDFERSHLEAFLIQLFGAYAGLFLELNEDLDCGLPPEGVSLGKMRDALKAKGVAISPKLTSLYALEQDTSSWLSQAKTMRDHVTHIGGIPLSYYMGTGVTAFRHPKTLEEIPGEYFNTLGKWLEHMESLIATMRS